MEIIQGSDLNNVFSKLNATAASIDQSGTENPHIIYPYFVPNSTTVRGQDVLVTIFVKNVDFGASVSFGDNVIVKNVKYFRYNDAGVREQLNSTSFKATEIQCIITLPPDTVIPNDTILSVSIQNLNNRVATNNTDFIISSKSVKDKPIGNLTLDITSAIGTVGIVHKNDQKVNNTVGSQILTIPYREIFDSPGGSMKIEIRDDRPEYIPTEYYRISIEEFNTIFVEKYDAFRNTLIGKIKTEQVGFTTKTNISFSWGSGDIKSMMVSELRRYIIRDLNDRQLDKINAFNPIKGLEVSYTSQLTNLFRYELVGDVLERISPIRSTETIKEGEIQVSGDPGTFFISFDETINKNLNRYSQLRLRVKNAYLVKKLVSGGSRTLQTIASNNYPSGDLWIPIDQVYNFSVDRTSIQATQFGGDFKVKINVDENLEWTFAEDTTSQEFSWISPVEFVGSRGSKEVTLRVKPNVLSTARSTRLQLLARNRTSQLLAEIKITQDANYEDRSLVKFWFDFDPNKNTGPFPNTKDSPTNRYSPITVPYYTKEGNNELLILNGSNRTNPISLYGHLVPNAVSSLQPVPLTFTFKTNENSLNEGEFYVYSVRGFENTNFNPNGFWGDSNINFPPIPQQVRGSGPADLQIVQFTIKYKVNNTIGETTVYYRLQKIEELKPTFTTNPDGIVAKVDANSKAWFGFVNDRGSIEILGKTKSGKLNPRISLVNDRNIFSVNSVKFYKNWKKPSYISEPTVQLDYILANRNNNPLTPNVYDISFTRAFTDGSGPAGAGYLYNTWGVVQISYKNNLGDISDHTIEFPISRQDVYTQSYFSADPRQTFIDVNKSYNPIIRENGTEYYKFKVTSTGYEEKEGKRFNYGYTPFEPAPLTFTITDVELIYTDSDDRVEIIEPPTTRQPNNLTYGFTLNNFDVHVYRLREKVIGKVRIEYRNSNENIPNENPTPNEEYLYFEIIPRIENDPEPPGPPPPPLPPTYIVTAKTNADLNIQVDCNGSILSGNLPILVSATQTNKNNSSDSRNLSITNSETLNRGEFRILSAVSDTDNLNFTISNDQSTVTLVADFLHKNYVVTVTIEYRDDNSNLLTTTTLFKINRIPGEPYTVNFTPDPSNINISVNYENEILAVSNNTITINGIQSNSLSSTPLLFTPTQLIKGTFKVSKIEGSIVLNLGNLTNVIELRETGNLTTSGNILVHIEYIDSCGVFGTSIVNVPFNRIPPKGQEVSAKITPNSQDLFVNFRFSLLQRPIPIPHFMVELTEKEIGSPPLIDYQRKMKAVTSDVLQKNEFKIINVYDSSPNTDKVILKYDLLSGEADKFKIDVKYFKDRTNQLENCFVVVAYKDLSGKPGQLTIPFSLKRILLPREDSIVSVNADPNQQTIVVTDKFEIIDSPPYRVYDELKDIRIDVQELLINRIDTKKSTYVKLASGEKLKTDGTNDSTFTIDNIYAFEQRPDSGMGAFIEDIGFEVNDVGAIRLLANYIRTNVLIKINVSYVDNYGNEGSRELLTRIIPVVTPPLITRIEYPEGINARDYAGFNVDFDVNFESEFTTNVAVYVNVDDKTYGQNSFYGRYKSDDFAKFNMDDLIKRFNINTGPENDTFTFTLVLVPERLEPDNKILIGQIEVIEIVFNKSDIQIPRPYIINNLNAVIKPKFDFTVYKDEVAKYLNHYLHFDNYEPRLIANWERDDITFSEFELDDLGNEIVVEENPTLILKMYEPLPEEIQPNTSIWISKQRS